METLLSSFVQFILNTVDILYTSAYQGTSESCVGKVDMFVSTLPTQAGCTTVILLSQLYNRFEELLFAHIYNLDLSCSDHSLNSQNKPPV